MMNNKLKTMKVVGLGGGSNTWEPVFINFKRLTGRLLTFPVFLRSEESLKDITSVIYVNQVNITRIYYP